MTTGKKTTLFFLSTLLFVSSISAQQTNISIGPTFTIGKGYPGIKDRRGLGGSIEFYQRLFEQSGLRVHAGFEQFHQPGAVNDKVNFISIRGGYQHYFFSPHFFVAADAGLARLSYPDIDADGYNLFSLSAGAAYTIYFQKNDFLQLQASYVFTDNNEPFNKYGYYGWVTFRVAYGLGFSKIKAKRGTKMSITPRF